MDPSNPTYRLPETWRSLSARFAVGIGAGAALISLLSGTPVWVASVRGALSWFGARFVARACERALRASNERRAKLEAEEELAVEAS